MDTEQFVEEINKIRRRFNFCIVENCDLWNMMTGFLFYRDEYSEEPFAHITGITYSRDGSCLEGDFKGFLNILDEAVKVEYDNGAG